MSGVVARIRSEGFGLYSLFSVQDEPSYTPTFPMCLAAQLRVQAARGLEFLCRPSSSWDTHIKVVTDMKTI